MNIYREETWHFIDACLGNASYQSNFANDLRMCRLVQACEQSSAKSLVVRV